MNKQKIYEELDNIWYHYKAHILIGIFVAAIAAYTIYSSLNNETKDTALQVILSGNQVSMEQKENLQQSATEKVLDKNYYEAKSIVKMDFWQANGRMNGTLQQKMVAMITTKEIDVVVIDKQTFSILAHQGSFIKLDQIQLPEDVHFLTNAATETDKQQQAYGIKMDQNQRLKDAGFVPKDKVLGIVSNSQRKEKDVQLVKWLVQP